MYLCGASCRCFRADVLVVFRHVLGLFVKRTSVSQLRNSQGKNIHVVRALGVRFQGKMNEEIGQVGFVCYRRWGPPNVTCQIWLGKMNRWLYEYPLGKCSVNWNHNSFQSPFQGYHVKSLGNSFKAFEFGPFRKGLCIADCRRRAWSFREFTWFKSLVVIIK